MCKKKRNRLGMSGRNRTRSPYCGSSVVLRSADGIYRENKRDAKLYVCSKYPVCDAYARVQEGSKRIPIGSMADGELRALRIEAHRRFDRIHQTGLMSKKDAYTWLADVISSPMAHAHIGQLGKYYCKVVIEESNRFLDKYRDKAIWKNNGRGIRPLAAGGEQYAIKYGTAAAGH